MATGIFPPDSGGPATYVPALAEALQRLGHQVEVVAQSPSTTGNVPYPYPVHRPSRPSLPAAARSLVALASILWYGRTADVILAAGLPFQSVIAAALLRKPLALRVVGDYAYERSIGRGWVTGDFDSFQHRQHGPRVSVLKAARAWWTRRAATVIVPSEYLRGVVENWGAASERVQIVYNAVDLPSELPDVDMARGTRFRIVTVGRLVRWKHVDRIIRAIAGLPEVELVVVGEGPEGLGLRTLVADLELGSRVRFTGQRSRRESLALMAASDLFVLASSYEGLPHVVLEAMSLGVPVVATAAGGTPEVVRDGVNGKLVAVGAEEELSSAIAYMRTDDEARARMAQEARATSEAFSFERMVYETEMVLLSTAGGPA